MKRTIIVIGALILAGCATTPTPNSQVNLISGEQIISPRYFQRADAKQSKS